MTLCLSNYGDKCCKLYVLMFGLWLFSRFTPPLTKFVSGKAKSLPIIFPGPTLRGVKSRGRNRRQVATPIEATSVAGAPGHRTCCVMFYRATVVGRGRNLLLAHVWLYIERSSDVPFMLRATQSPKKRI